MARLTWRKSTRSGTNGGNCVEVAAAQRVIYVRDSKNPHGPILSFERGAWTRFVDGLKR